MRGFESLAYWEFDEWIENVGERGSSRLMVGLHIKCENMNSKVYIY